MKFSEYREQYQEDMDLEQIVEVFFLDALDAEEEISMEHVRKETGLPLKRLELILSEVKASLPPPMPQQNLTEEDAVLTFIRINRGFVHEEELLGVGSVKTVDDMVSRGRLMSWGEGYYSLPDVEPPKSIACKFKKFVVMDADLLPEDRVVSWIERQGRVAWTLDDIAVAIGLSARVLSSTIKTLIKQERIEFIEEIDGQRFYKQVLE